MSWQSRHFDTEKLIENDVRLALISVQMDYLDAFLAGGYLRDRYLGVPPKDVDFFTFKPVLEGREELIIPFNEEKSGDGDVRIGQVEGLHHGDLTIPSQIIHLTSPDGPSDARTEVTYFLFGAQQIILDEERGFVDATEDFWRDIEYKTMTVCRCANEKDASIGYRKYQRLLERYPGWKLVVPKRYSELYKKHVSGSTNVLWLE